MVRNGLVAAIIGAVAACGGGDGVSLRPTSPFTLSLLVSDGWTPAISTDGHLGNPWGLAALTGGPMSVANNLDHSITQYDGTGLVQPLVIDTDVTGYGAGDVTGIVASNSETDFIISDGMVDAPARFLFVTESGSLRGWSADTDTVVVDATVGIGGSPRLTGLATAAITGGARLYVADFGSGAIHVMDETFDPVDDLGMFEDASLPEGYSPYNIRAIQRQGATVLAVAYALRDDISGEVVAGEGNGALNLYSTAGVLLARLVRPGGRLNAPWGLALAPANFGALGGALLAGSTGDGRIRGFSVIDGDFLGTVVDANELPIVVDDLHGLAFGNGSRNQPANALFVTAGSNGGVNGLYARIDPGAAAPDLIAPHDVMVTAPAAAATVSGSIDITASASDNVGVVRVVFSVEAGGTTSEIGSVTAAPYTINWNSGTVADGPVSLRARALDAKGNSTTSAAVTITVDNPPGVASPTVSITSPAPGDVGGSVTVSADASDDVGVASVEFFVGATSLGKDTTAPYSVAWNALAFTGTQDLTAVATDGEGNMTTSAVVQVNVVVTTVTLAQLQASIFTPLCSSCHNGGADNGLVNRLNLASASASFSTMVNIASETEPGLRVQPNNPDNSYLVRKLEGSHAVGERMPVGGPYLDQADLDRVRTWIQLGALR